MNSLGKDQMPFFFLADFEMKKIEVWSLAEIPDDISFSIAGFDIENIARGKEENVKISPIVPEIETYAQAFEQVKSEILYGNSFLTNLCWKTPIKSNADIQSIYSVSKSKYKLIWQDKFVVFSPECFVKIQDEKIYSFPMKGTIDAGVTDAKNTILNDPKELAEHNTIVDLIRNDLSMVAHNVQLEKFRYLDLIHSNDRQLYQVSSEISGELNSNYREHIGSIVFRLLPAGSVSGAPKPKTLEIIQSAEKEPRGYYTGVAGVFDGNNLDTFVLIRYIENDKGQLYYRSGGGLTFQSDMQSEFNEILQKIYVPTA